MKTPLPQEAPKKEKYSFSLSDLCPPALVLDMRQSMRSPLNIILAVVGVLLTYSTVSASSDQAIDPYVLLCVHTLLLLAFVPFRAGMKIARDIRERGSNFLQLCPLSAGRIVWGQFLSCSVQLILLSLPLLPLYCLCVDQLRVERSSYGDSISVYMSTYEGGFLMVMAFVFVSALLLTALLMALAILPLAIRVLIQTGIIVLTVILFFGLSFDRAYFSHHAVEPFDGLPVTMLCLMVLAVMLGFVGMLLILASRHYSSQVEASSGRLRLLGLACLLGIFAFYTQFFYGEVGQIILIMGGYAFYPLLALAIMDELMPNESSLGLSPRRRGFVGYLTRRATGANMIYVLLLAMVYAAGSWWLFYSGAHRSEFESSQSSDFCNQIMGVLAPVLALIYSAYAALVLTDLALVRSSRSRMLGYGISVLLLFMLGAFVEAKEYLPFHCLFHSIYDFDEVAVGRCLVMAGCCLGSFLLLAAVHALRGVRR